MAQVKVYGIKDNLLAVRERLSATIHSCVMDVLGLPRGKRAHCFFPMERDNMLCPEDRSNAYTIIEISMMSGRSESTRKKLIRHLFDRIQEQVGIAHQDLEICIHESPPCNWGFRGFHGDEAKLNYSVNV